MRVDKNIKDLKFRNTDIIKVVSGGVFSGKRNI